MFELNQVICLCFLVISIQSFDNQVKTVQEIENYKLKAESVVNILSSLKNVKLTNTLKKIDNLIKLGLERELFDELDLSTSNNGSFNNFQNILMNFQKGKFKLKLIQSC